MDSRFQLLDVNFEPSISNWRAKRKDKQSKKTKKKKTEEEYDMENDDK